jgi:shikimate kinase
VPRNGNIFLTGFMGTGKSVLAEELARRLGREAVDTDREIERLAGKTVREIFRDEGEEAFRQLEREAIRRACERPGAVVATGGGAVLDPANRRRMRESGTVVCLEASPETILDRVGSASDRPLLAGAADPLARIRELLAERASAYAEADLRVETSGKGVAEIAVEILERLGERR